MTYSWKGLTEKGPEKNPSNPRIRTAGHPMSSRGHTQSPPGGMDFLP